MIREISHTHRSVGRPRPSPTRATMSVLALLAGVALTTAARAQDPVPPQPPDSVPAAGPQPGDTVGGRTHIVKKGDTLWDLARLYLNDPFLWPEIYRINTSVVEDPHWIYPGEELRLPGPSVLVAQEEPRVAVDLETADEPPAGPTVFSQTTTSRRFSTAPAAARPSSGGRRVTPAVQESRTAVRAGQYYAAPWFDRNGGPRDHGVVVGSAEVPGIAQASDRFRLQPHEFIYVTLPRSASVSRGDRLLAYTLGPDFSGVGQVVIPTGILEIVSVGDDERDRVASKARIVQQFAEVRVGQGVMNLERFSIPLDVRPSPVELGVRSRVVWIPSEAVLPSLQHYVMLDASSRDGVRVGDQFTLLRTETRSDRGVKLPEERLAIVQIVRVTERGATGVVIDQRHPSIDRGTVARMTARMP